MCSLSTSEQLIAAFCLPLSLFAFLALFPCTYSTPLPSVSPFTHHHLVYISLSAEPVLSTEYMIWYVCDCMSVCIQMKECRQSVASVYYSRCEVCVKNAVSSGKRTFQGLLHFSSSWQPLEKVVQAILWKCAVRLITYGLHLVKQVNCEEKNY